MKENWRFWGQKSGSDVKCNLSYLVEYLCSAFSGVFFSLSLQISIYFVFFLQDVVIANDYFKQCCQLMTLFLPHSGL